MTRDNFSQLPSYEELQSVLAAEAKRDLPKGKKESHYFDFSPLIKLAKHFKIDDKILTTVYTQQDVAEEDLLAKERILTEKVKERLLDRELSLKDIRECDIAYDYLAAEDKLENADIIFVFGAKTLLRIEKAIEVYKQGLAPRMIVSGRGPYYAGDKFITEAEKYAHIAIEKGVPEHAIITENQSITIPDNVRSSLNLLDEQEIFYSSIILVNSPYTQRRGYAHFKKYLPDSVKLMRINSETGPEYRRDSWYKNSKGIDVILSEYLKAKVAVSLNTA
jgi:uncharacterized SAM-binding protein YcdF (DUF218 family)